MGQKGFFSIFPKINYPYIGKMVQKNTIGKVKGIDAVDLTVRYKFKDAILRDPLAAFPYTWKDGDRPDTIARLYYGDEKYSWVVLLSGSIYDWIHELPLSQRELDEYLTQMYVGQLAGVTNVYQLQTVIHHYEDGDGDVIDEFTFTNTPDPDKKIVSIYEFEVANNEQRRKTKLISREYLSLVVAEFESQMQTIKKTRKNLPITLR